MDSLCEQFHREYLSAIEQVEDSLNSRTSKTSPEALLEEVKLVVSFCTDPLHFAHANCSDEPTGCCMQLGKLKMEARTLPAHIASLKLQEVLHFFLQATSASAVPGSQLSVSEASSTAIHLALAV